MYTEINAVCPEFHMKNVDRLCAQEVESYVYWNVHHLDS